MTDKDGSNRQGDLPTEGHEASAVGWQPMSTAPTDGTRVMLWAGYWHNLAYVGWDDDEGGPVWFNGDVVVDDPEYWMPLPAAPDTAVAAEQVGTDGPQSGPVVNQNTQVIP